MKWILILFSIITLKTCNNTSLEQNTTMLNNNFSITTLNGTNVSAFNLTISFNDSTKQVSGFSGCNRFFGSYTIKNNTIKLGPLASTRKMCMPKLNSVESKLLDALTKANHFTIKNDTLILLEEENKLLTAVKKDFYESVSFEYTQHSKGRFQLIKVNKKTITIQNKRAGTITKTDCNEIQWQKIINAFKLVNTDSISSLKAPSNKRLFDGAAIAKLTVTFDGETYETPSFDHGNPHPNIANLVKEILSLTQNVE
ncbi:META domain-containing protein [Seonamhaeicola sp. NFXS20]|uniref:META domain-containing protein n=1 Tax=Seonamhaeicola sp. NFXS20 TaxID=2816959 RepID=UPI003B8AB673